MKALVTGATGFVGSHLAEALRRRGDEVTVLARSAQKAAALESLGVRVVPGDLGDKAALARAVAGQDEVYHVAGVVAARSEADFLAANRDGTANVVAASQAGGGPRLVLVSSMAAAGPSPRDHPLRGDEPPAPVTAYGRSKLAAEQVVRGSALPWTILRPPTVYGPRDREVLKVFRLVRLGLGPVFGDGTQQLSAVHASDLAEALIAAARASATVGRGYYACHPEVVTSADLVRRIGEAMGRRPTVIPVPAVVGRAVLGVTEAVARIARQTTILTTDKANEFFQPAWTGDPTPLTRDSGWTAAHDLRSGLADTYRWYRSAGWL
jgi:nucleoside-diphosphate-sugar epimerase